MVRKKRQRTQLPRLTVLAMSKRELVSFVTAVERLGHLVADLADQVTKLGVKVSRKRSCRGAAEATEPSSNSSEG